VEVQCGRDGRSKQEAQGKGVLIGEAATLEADDMSRWNRFRREFSSHRARQHNVPRMHAAYIAVALARLWLRNMPPFEADMSIFARLRKGAIPEHISDFLFTDLCEFAAVCLESELPRWDERREASSHVRLEEKPPRAAFGRDAFSGPVSYGAEDALRIAKRMLKSAEMIVDRPERELANNIGRIRAEMALPAFDSPGEGVDRLFSTVSSELQRTVGHPQSGFRTRNPPFYEADLIRNVQERSASMVSIARDFLYVFGLACAM
jgi:hypothetical protein